MAAVEGFPAQSGDYTDHVDRVLSSTVGTDSDGNSMKSATAMWASATRKGIDEWYRWGVEYYRRQEATVDGALGGLASLTNKPDIGHSLGLLKIWSEERLSSMSHEAADSSSTGASGSALPSLPMAKTKALDLGGGMGRVSSAVLSKYFSTVDMVESSPAMVEAAGAHIPKASQGTLSLGTMQDFVPPPGTKYTCIWMQFAAGYLTDPDLVGLLRRCASVLDEHPTRCIILKESVTSSPEQAFYLDREDNNVIRGREYFRALIGLAGLDVALEVDQKPWPAGLYPLVAFLCVPKGTA